MGKKVRRTCKRQFQIQLPTMLNNTSYLTLTLNLNPSTDLMDKHGNWIWDRRLQVCQKFLGTKVPAFVALAASGDYGQTKQNVKITFINCGFIKKNQRMQINETDNHESSVLSARILRTEQEPCCHKEDASLLSSQPVPSKCDHVTVSLTVLSCPVCPIMF